MDCYVRDREPFGWIIWLIQATDYICVFGLSGKEKQVVYTFDNYVCLNVIRKQYGK